MDKRLRSIKGKGVENEQPLYHLHLLAWDLLFTGRMEKWILFAMFSVSGHSVRERERDSTLSDLGTSFLKIASWALILSLRLFSAWLWLLEAEAPLSSAIIPSEGDENEGNPSN